VLPVEQPLSINATHSPSLQILTQNVSGIRREGTRMGGPKIGAIKALINRHTDFTILTETKCAEQNIRKLRLKYGMKLTLITNHGPASAGVAIYSKREHKLLEGSTRRSEPDGHYICGVYDVLGNRMVVAGVYGVPDNNDNSSAVIYEQLTEQLQELKILYNTNLVLAAGDFNCGINDTDFSTQNYKPRTTAKLVHMINEHNLIDLGAAHQNFGHTYYRRGDSRIHSRIDFILTNINSQNTQYYRQPTIFDHLSLVGVLGKIEKNYNPPTMKDFILSSEKFLEGAEIVIESVANEVGIPAMAFQKHGNNHDGQQPVCDALPPHAEQDHIHELNEILAHNNTTSLHLFNEIIHRLQSLHNDLLVESKKISSKQMKEMSNSFFTLQKQIQDCSAGEEEERNELELALREQQRELSNKLEMKDLAATNRIKNFYKLNNGKNTSASFNAVREPRKGRSISKISHNNNEISDKTQIAAIMQDWYEATANNRHQQTVSVEEFLLTNNITLPTISDGQRESLITPITLTEIESSLKDAKINSASGPSGQSIALYKYIFLQAPLLFAAAINQIAFQPELASLPEFAWIKHRKIIYIPKKGAPVSPGDYRPLSMLEVLYKIPSRILASRCSLMLPDIIGEHQHGFMANRGIQEPTLLMTHVIQDANRTGNPVQILSLDIEKAFDRISHTSIQQSLIAFGFPEIFVNAITFLALGGTAGVEVNGLMGATFSVQTGSGQGDPLSSILFTIDTEPLNRALVENFSDFFYITAEGITIEPLLYADDNNTAYTLRNGNDFMLIQNLYQQYTCVSGLNVNIAKSTALCINTPQRIVQELQGLGFQTPESSTYLGTCLSGNIADTVRLSFEKIDTKSVDRRVLSTCRPTDLLHKSKLINAAMTPLYNHIFMSLPIEEQYTKRIFDQILKFLWTRQVDGETYYKRRLVSKLRVNAGYNMGGLNIPHPDTVAEGLQINFLQKIYKKIKNEDVSKMVAIVSEVLSMSGRPTLEEHVERLGSKQWDRTSEVISNINLFISQAFRSVGKFLQLQEIDPISWQNSAIHGHSLESKLFPLNRGDRIRLTVHNVNIIGQLSQLSDLGKVTAEIHPSVAEFGPILSHKLVELFNFCIKTNKAKNHLLGNDTLLKTLFLEGKNMSIWYKKLITADLERKIKIPPAYKTRMNDRIARPDLSEFPKSYRFVTDPIIPSKTKEISFQIINRTLWTNNKAYKSGIRDDPACPVCERTETIEHLVADCDNYSYLRWTDLNQALTNTLRAETPNIARIELTFQNILFNLENEALHRVITDPAVRRIILMLVMETKRDIYYRRTQNVPRDPGPVVPIRRYAHMNACIKKIQSYLQYVNSNKWSNSILFLDRLHEAVCDLVMND
jgi:hypothetical protein